MSVVNVKEKWSGLNGQLEQMNVAGALRAVASRGFTVLTDGSATLAEIIHASGIPAIGADFPANPGIPCRRQRALPLSPILFEVVCDYSGQQSPLLAPAKISWQEASSSELVDSDADGDALVNSVGEPYQDSMEIADPVAVILRNEATSPMAACYAYWNAINADWIPSGWMGTPTPAGTAAGITPAPTPTPPITPTENVAIWPPGTVRMLPITGDQMDDGSSFYWAITYRLQFRRDGWNRRVPNKGKQYRETPGGVLIPVKDRLHMDDALLNADGTLLNGVGVETTGGDPTVWLTNPKYRSVAFSPLNLPWDAAFSIGTPTPTAS